MTTPSTRNEPTRPYAVGAGPAADARTTIGTPGKQHAISARDLRSAAVP